MNANAACTSVTVRVASCCITVISVLLAGCQNGSEPAPASEAQIPKDDPSGATPAFSSISVSLGDDGSAVTISGRNVEESPDGIVRFAVPGQAQFEVTIPFEGEPPSSIVCQLICDSAPNGPSELGSVSSKPEIKDGQLAYSVELPLYSAAKGTQRCRIRTVKGFDPQNSVLHEGQFQIEFPSAESGQ